MTGAARIRAAIGTEGASFDEMQAGTGLDRNTVVKYLSTMTNPRHANHQVNVADGRYMLNNKGKRLLERDTRLLAEGRPDPREKAGRPKGVRQSRRGPKERGMTGKLFECIADQDGVLLLQCEDGTLLRAEALVLQ